MPHPLQNPKVDAGLSMTELVIYRIQTFDIETFITHVSNDQKEASFETLNDSLIYTRVINTMNRPLYVPPISLVSYPHTYIHTS